MFLHRKPISPLAAREINHIFRGKGRFLWYGKVMSTGCDCGENTVCLGGLEVGCKKGVEDEGDFKCSDLHFSAATRICPN